MAKSSGNMMDKLVSLSKRRGIVFQSSEIYGGINSCWDYGPVGVELKRNIKEFWWRSMVFWRNDIEGIDASIIMHPTVWKASGHVDNFTDPMVDCKQCKRRFRADEIEGDKCPVCGGELTKPRQFNLMFKTFMGPVQNETNSIYLRPETAQGIYVNFLNVQKASRKKIPFGVAQIGKAFRNEITPGNFIFRTREFEQMEMQYFVKPGTDEEFFEEWKATRMAWYKELGIRSEKLRFHQHGPDELAHYAKAAFDIEFEFPFGWKELEGIHNRTDFDLRRHQEFSGKDLRYFDDQTHERYIPYVIETSAGVDRTLLTVLSNAYQEEEVKGETRVVLKINPKISPIKIAVFPLIKKEGMPEIAQKIQADLQRKYKTFYDISGAIGRRYRRQDEIGTPYCITVDSQTLEDQTVTVRDRDTMEQQRVASAQLLNYFRDKLDI